MSHTENTLSEMGLYGQVTDNQVSDENKRLMEQIKNRENDVKGLVDKLESNCDIKKFMPECIKNLTRELKNREALCRAKKREDELEKQLTAQSERETGNLRLQVAKMEKDRRSLIEKRIMKESNILEAEQKLEKFQNQMKWDKLTLDGFLEEAAHKEEETMSIIKCEKQDEKMIKSLTLEIERMELLVRKNEKLMVNEETETKSAQIYLAKNKDNLVESYVQKHTVIQQWENTIKQIKQRDEELQPCVQELAQTKHNIRSGKDTIADKKALMETLGNHNEIQRKVDTARRQAHRLRLHLKEKEFFFNQLEKELESCKALRDRTCDDFKSMMSKVSGLKRENEDYNKKLQKAKDVNAALEEKLQVMTQTVLSDEEAAAQWEQLVNEQSAALKELDSQLDNMKDILRRKEDLLALNAKENDSDAEISRTKSSLTCINKEVKQLEGDLITLQRTVVEQKTQIEGLRKKLAEIKDVIHSDEELMLDKKIAQLSKFLEQKRRAANVLENAVKESERDTRLLHQEMEKSEDQWRDLTDKINELERVCETSENEQRRLRLSKQNNTVDFNIMKVEVKRKRDLLYKNANSMLSLEKRKLDFQTVLKERELECRSSRELLWQQLKVFEQENQKISAELNERLYRIDMMKIRFELMTPSSEIPEGEEMITQAHYIAQAALEMEELRRKEDSLYEELCKAEKEIKALEDTVQSFDHNNSAYHRSIGQEKESNPEQQEILMLKEELKAFEHEVGCKNILVRGLKEELQDRDNASESLLREQHAEMHELDLKQSAVSKLNKFTSSQLEKLDRAAKQCSKLTKIICSEKNTETVDFEKDVMLREMHESYQRITDMLNKTSDLDLIVVLNQSFQEAGLPSPFLTSIFSSKQQKRKPAGH